MVSLTVFLIAYYAVHSILAALRIKAFVKTKLPRFFPYYRLFYNLLSFVSLVAIMIFQRNLPPSPIGTPPEWVIIIGYALIAAGLIVIGATFKNYDKREFLGIKPMNEFNSSLAPLITTGLNAYVRHPIYSGIVLALSGFLIISFDYKTLIIFALSLLYILIGATLEERKLIMLYGNEYVEYKKRVKMLVPV